MYMLFSRWDARLFCCWKAPSFTQLREDWTTTNRFGPGKLTSRFRNPISADRQRVQKDDFQGTHGKELQNRAKITAKM